MTDYRPQIVLRPTEDDHCPFCDGQGGRERPTTWAEEVDFAACDEPVPETMTETCYRCAGTGLAVETTWSKEERDAAEDDDSGRECYHHKDCGNWLTLDEADAGDVCDECDAEIAALRRTENKAAPGLPASLTWRTR